MKESIKKQAQQLLTKDGIFTAIQHVVPQQKLSETAGRLAASNNPFVKKAFVSMFAKAYGITLDEYGRKNLSDFKSFNDFFTRELAKDARPINDTANGIVSPADGVISQIGYIEQDQLLQAKGRYYAVGHLLADTDNKDADYYSAGSFATVYLAPSNYHRVHMPFDGKLIETRYVPGALFSVNNVTAQNVPDLFARNERLVCIFETQHGRAAVVLVGAMIVAGIETVATGKIERSDSIQTLAHNLTLNKGDELGRFYLGSTAIVVMPKSAGVEWSKTMQSGSAVQMGQLLGIANK
ncbi:archaetidylserine decarboxylase [Psychrobacter sp.]|uniref:archaetidylserine decarboxylase n=1 Tax=Psychrobacter sp. TaxID=56811 RepID=UPI0025CFDBBD|nr:archaetidylserine decarboxylase [Psychrobacter sp.]